MLSFLRRSASTSSTPPILNIPEELIAEIAYHAREWSSLKDGVDASLVKLPSDLASMAASCSVLHAAATPLLYRDIQITSAARLRSLGAASPEKLGHIRVLSLHLDSDFFAEFAHSIDHLFRTPGFVDHPSTFSQGPPGSPPPLIQVLCSILVRTPHLQSLVIRLAKASTRSSAWKHFSFRSRGIELARSFRSCLSKALRELETLNPNGSQGSPLHQGFILPDLTYIHLDALEEIFPLLRIAPNLAHLSVRMLEGFDTASCEQLVSDLEWTKPRKLRSLAFSPRSLHLPGLDDTSAAGVELLRELGRVCPGLEELDLKVHAYGCRTLPFVPVYNQSSFWGLVAALRSMGNLRALHLPGNLLEEEEMDLFLLPEESDGQFSPERRTTLEEVSKRELVAVGAMSESCPTLARVSWVRRRASDVSGAECSIEYDIKRNQSSTAQELDDIDIVQIHLPPTVLEIPRKISSPARGPTLFGYSRSSEGLREFKQDHPHLWFALISMLLIGCFGLLYMRFNMSLHVVCAIGVVHMLYTRSFSLHVALLVVAHSLFSPRQLTKKVAKYSCVTGLV
ncbi:hypothetical protein FRC03_010737 [Tulasnella sp. 419]|nr:hypothetical protein FRC03_010737 [Tulasnella sp. 419]